MYNREIVNDFFLPWHIHSLYATDTNNASSNSAEEKDQEGNRKGHIHLIPILHYKKLILKEGKVAKQLTP